MAAETLACQNGVVSNEDIGANSTAEKKSWESDRRRSRRSRKQKKNNKASKDDDDMKENTQVVVEQVEIEYVPEKVDLGEGLDEEFRNIFEKFSSFSEVIGREDNDKKDDEAAENSKEEENDDDDQKEKGVSNKKKKLQRRMKIVELKQISSRPDVVEVWDSTAAESKLLVFLKSYRNTVPVPRHWCQKKKYLQGKRGIEKKPFQLPDFIAATGIENIIQAYDAFFEYQTKPKQLSYLGDLYYEGKEFEVKLMRELKPGVLSRELKEAIGMPEGGVPPPWLINMQRYGPPPSYPHLKIPGLNAPIPQGASFGYHLGGWGKPPVDGYGRPLYGDVFGVHQQEQPNYEEEPVDKSKHWGDLKVKVLEAGIQSVVDSRLSSTPTGVETPEPDVIDLRKQKKRKEPERPIYQVLEEKEEELAPGTLLGTTHTYVVTGTQDNAGAKRVNLLKGQKSEDKVDVTLQPEELDVMENVLSAKYEEAREEETLRNQREDFSHMVAENEKKRKRKMQEKEGKSKKKDFKF